MWSRWRATALTMLRRSRKPKWASPWEPGRTSRWRAPALRCSRATCAGSRARVIQSARGRGVQLHAGACASTGDVLWFLHADTRAPVDAAERIAAALGEHAVGGGNFALTFDGDTRPARVLTRAYPHFRKLGLCYGDSGIFIRRGVYEAIGGFEPYPIFEDLDLIKRLRKRGRFVHLDCALTTSSRRFE